jgi:short subunit dehydrogenase-like uncharacterized protein
VAERRRFDVVLYGATGFAGGLTAEYLARNAPPGLRWALAGRSRGKLAAVRERLAALDPACARLELLQADAGDAVSLSAVAEATRVVATAVGPYLRFGAPLVAACARAGTDYADLTGEVLFMRDTIERHDADAQRSGARIVHTCGFDSIPSDLGVLLLHEAARADGAGDLEDTTLVVRAMKGKASGGTIASLTGELDDSRANPAWRAVLEDPYALSPDRAAEPDLGREPGVRGPVHDDALGQWLAPFVMASINTRVVRRSNALQGWAYGRGLR